LLEKFRFPEQLLLTAYLAVGKALDKSNRETAAKVTRWETEIAGTDDVFTGGQPKKAPYART